MSAARLERWRRADLLPRHPRRGLGRGRGSVSVLELRTVEIADALARSSGQGKDLRVTVLAWYMRAGTPAPHSRQPVPEPPFEAVRGALVWALRRSPVQRLIEQARRAKDDADTDRLYTAADRVLARWPGPFGHPGRMREALLDDDQDVPPPRGGQRGMVHLIAAVGLPPGEVSGESFAEAMTGLFPEIAPHQLVEAYEEAERAGTLIRLRHDARHRDAVAEAAAATTSEELARAREVARTLGACGSMYLLHGMLLPDTPGQRAVRARIDELGVGEIVVGVAQSFGKVAAADVLSLCLDPYIALLGEQLQTLLTDHADQLLRRPGELDSAKDLMDAWLAAIHAASGPHAQPPPPE